MNDKKRKASNGRRPGLRVSVLRHAVRVVSALAPAIAARWIYYLWFKTYRHATPPREHDWIRNAQRRYIDTPQGRLSALTWGSPSAKRVLLVHGWNGRASQMGAFAQPLLQAGFTVTAMDLPGHGESSGNNSNLFAGAHAVHAAQQAWGPFDAVVGHSFGAAVNLLAMFQGLHTDCAVSISQPPNIRWLLEFYCRFVGVPARVETRVMGLIEKRFGHDVWRLLRVEELVKSVAIKALVVHDKNDTEVPFEQGQFIAAAWPGADFFATKGLGHYRVLRAPDVVQVAVRFIRDHTK